MATLSSDARVLGDGIQDASMEEVGRPPGEKLTGAGSWVEKVRSSQGGGLPVPEMVLDAGFVASQMRVEFPNGEDGEPVVTIGHEVLTAMNGLWKQCMIVKVLGRHIAIAAMNKKLKELWNPKGGMYVLDLPRQFFMVRFDLEEDYLAALTGGPWRLFGSLLMVQAWSPEFDPAVDDIATTPVWVRISNLPVNFYHKAILMGIAEGLGKPIRVDPTTLRFERARFARICVEVNLKKPLKGTVLINGERYFVSYEGLNTICSSCGVYGHLTAVCPHKVSERVEQLSVQNGSQVLGSRGQDKDGFTAVRKTGWRRDTPVRKVVFVAGGSGENQERNVGEIEGITGSGKLAISNRFAGLNADLVEDEMRKESELREANKENEELGNILNVGSRVVQGKGVNQGTDTRGKGGSRGSDMEKRVSGLKNWKSSGPKGKGAQFNKPTRGLIFGSTRGDKEVISAGKRLRVEMDSVGRAGGVFTTASMGTVVDRIPLQRLEGPSKGEGGGSVEPTRTLDLNSHDEGMEIGVVHRDE